IEYTNEDMEWANENTDELVDLLTDSLGVDQAVVEKMVSRRTYSMTAMTSESVSELQDIADLFYTEGLIENKVTVSDHV
ncbi:sulfonate ABC transporter substrate-binding protein, partial [Enterococcus faecium]